MDQFPKNGFIPEADIDITALSLDAFVTASDIYISELPQGSVVPDPDIGVPEPSKSGVVAGRLSISQCYLNATVFQSRMSLMIRDYLERGLFGSGISLEIARRYLPTRRIPGR